MSNSVVLMKHRIEKALEFKDLTTEFFIGLGRTTSWDNNDSPPEPTGLETSIDELFGLVSSQIQIPEKYATVNIGTIEEISIEYVEGGSEGNSYTVEVLDSTGQLSVSLDVTLTGYDLVITLGTDGSGVLDSTQNIASNITSNINSLLEFDATFLGVGTGVFSTGESTKSFSGGLGPYINSTFVKEDSNGPIIYRGVDYTTVYDEDIYTENAFKIYFEGLIPVNEYPSIESYRQLSIYYNSLRDVGVDSSQLILNYPEDISDLGTLYSISNLTPIKRLPDAFEKLQLIVEF